MLWRRMRWSHWKKSHWILMPSHWSCQTSYFGGVLIWKKPQTSDISIVIHRVHGRWHWANERIFLWKSWRKVYKHFTFWKEDEIRSSDILLDFRTSIPFKRYDWSKVRKFATQKSQKVARFNLSDFSANVFVEFWKNLGDRQHVYSLWKSIFMKNILCQSDLQFFEKSTKWHFFVTFFQFWKKSQKSVFFTFNKSIFFVFKTFFSPKTHNVLLVTQILKTRELSFFRTKS